VQDLRNVLLPPYRGRFGVPDPQLQRRQARRWPVRDGTVTCLTRRRIAGVPCAAPSVAPHGEPAGYVGETVVALRSLDILDKASATIGPVLGTPRELVMSRSGTLTSAPERVSTMYVCASSSK
jgi:hypothetical protein